MSCPWSSLDGEGTSCSVPALFLPGGGSTLSRELARGGDRGIGMGMGRPDQRSDPGEGKGVTLFRSPFPLSWLGLI